MGYNMSIEVLVVNIPKFIWKLLTKGSIALSEERTGRRKADIRLRKKNKKKNLAHQRKSPSGQPATCASAFAAHSVKGRFASTLDLASLLRPPLLTLAAPKEISSTSFRQAGQMPLRPVFFV